MEEREPVNIHMLSLPEELIRWIGNAPVYESSGQSGARTVYVDRDGGAYLKIAARGSLLLSSQMQTYFAGHGLSSPVLRYLSADRDYMVTAPIRGEDGTSPRLLAEPQRLSEVFGQSLRRLHEVDASDCPVKDRTQALARLAAATPFSQENLDDIAAYIGPARADAAPAEIAAASGRIKNDVLIHGDYCLPNILLRGWALAGFIDVAAAGLGDRHYDLVWGLWTLNWNLKTPRYGQRFLDAYGRDRIEPDRLRVCGLLAAME